MAGNEDRGGVAEIIKLVSRTKIPIICIANEVPRKLMSLKAKCYNLNFSRPKTQQVVGNMLSVAHREGTRAACNVGVGPLCRPARWRCTRTPMQALRSTQS